MCYNNQHKVNTLSNLRSVFRVKDVFFTSATRPGYLYSSQHELQRIDCKLKNSIILGGATMKKIIYIHKQAGTKKDAVRITTPADIPEFLKGSVDIARGLLFLTCVEGAETCPVGSVIGYEESTQTPSGWNCWCVGNADTNLIEVDGVFYKKATVLQAMPVGKEFPEFLEGAKIAHNEDGSWTIQTDWGASTGFPGQAYWVLYGTKPDGTPDANILTKTEKSYRDYIVCDEDGVDVGWLYELDPA